MALRADKTLGSGCLMLFGLPFLLAGLYAGWQAVSAWGLAQEAADWVERPATLTRVDRHLGENIRLEVEYRYEFEGRGYFGDRIGVWSGSTTTSTQRNTLYNRLRGAMRAERTVPCYVDPHDPTRVLLVRTIKTANLLAFGAAFGGAFACAGVMVIGSGWASWRLARRRDSLRPLHPGEPWCWRDDWRRGVIQSSSHKHGWMLLAASFFWNAISFPMAYWIVVDADNTPIWVYLFLSFPLIGLGFFAAAVLGLLRSWRSGTSVFRMASLPGVIGGRLSGVIVATDRLRTAPEVLVRLSCTEMVGSGEDAKPEQIWGDERVIDRLLDSDEPSRVGVPVAFEIPGDLKASDPDQQIEWNLRATAKLPGPDFQADFEVPVFFTAETRLAGHADPGPLTEYERDRPLEELLRVEQIELIETPSGRRLAASASSGWPAKTASLVTAIAATAAVPACCYLGEWFAAFFLAVVAAILWGIAGQAWLAYSELTIDGDRWRAESGWHGLRRAVAEFTPSLINEIDTQSGPAGYVGTRITHQSNRLVARLADGRVVTLVRSVQSRACERKLLAELRRLAGERPAADAG